MSEHYPEILYCYLDEANKLALSTVEPSGQWAMYKHGEEWRAPENYYELEGYSDEHWQVFRRAPIYFHAEVRDSGVYSISLSHRSRDGAVG